MYFVKNVLPYWEPYIKRWHNLCKIKKYILTFISLDLIEVEQNYVK